MKQIMKSVDKSFLDWCKLLKYTMTRPKIKRLIEILK